MKKAGESVSQRERERARDREVTSLPDRFDRSQSSLMRKMYSNNNNQIKEAHGRGVFGISIAVSRVKYSMSGVGFLHGKGGKGGKAPE